LEGCPTGQPFGVLNPEANIKVNINSAVVAGLSNPDDDGCAAPQVE
jgi:hypothetical protein